jgi:hypothetical protein
MADFPLLRTGAVAQYPLNKSIVFATDVTRFVDGTEQRSRAYGKPLRRWNIQLELLDEGELARMEQFFRDQAGRGASFASTDPWDGAVYPNCSLDEDSLAVTMEGPGRGRTEMVVRENRE